MRSACRRHKDAFDFLDFSQLHHCQIARRISGERVERLAEQFIFCQCIALPAHHHDIGLFFTNGIKYSQMGAMRHAHFDMHRHFLRFSEFVGNLQDVFLARDKAFTFGDRKLFRHFYHAERMNVAVARLCNCARKCHKWQHFLAF